MTSTHIHTYCFVVLLCNLLTSICAAGTLFHRIAYVNVAKDDWSHYQQLFDGTYTHIITAFLLPDHSGQLLAVDAAQSFSLPLIKKAQAAGTHVLIAVGGMSVSYRVYLDIASDPTARQRFIQNVIRYMDEHGYDGVDLNFEGWFEGLTIAQRDHVNGLMRELAQAVKYSRPDGRVSVPLAPLYWLPMSADCELVNSTWIDLAHHMSYDFDVGNKGANGPWRVPGAQQYLYPGYVGTERSVWGALDYLLKQGCRADKLTAGLPFSSTVKEPWGEIEHLRDWEQVPLHPQSLEKADPLQWRMGDGPTCRGCESTGVSRTRSRGCDGVAGRPRRDIRDAEQGIAVRCPWPHIAGGREGRCVSGTRFLACARPSCLAPEGTNPEEP